MPPGFLSLVSSLPGFFCSRPALLLCKLPIPNKLVPQLDGLPFEFDYMEVDRDLKGMYLRRKTKDEIIHILVKTHRDYNDCESDFHFIYDDSKFYDDFDVHAGHDDDSDEMVSYMDCESDEEYEKYYDDDDDDDSGGGGEMKNEEESESDNEFMESLLWECGHSDFLERYFNDYDDDGETECDDDGETKYDDDGEELVDDLEDDVVPPLTLLVKILYGDNFDRCLQFVAHAYPDNRDELTINVVSYRKTKRSGQHVGLNHLDEFEGFFKERGIDATNLNHLFKCMDKKKKIGEAL